VSNGRGRHAKKIDTVHWTGGSFFGISQAAGSLAQTVLSAQHLPETLLRIRGEWIALLDGALAPGKFVRATAGFILVPEGTGTTVLWDPVGDADAPWIWWDTMNLAYSEAVTDVIPVGNVAAGRRVIDSKAMRKIRNTELQVVVTNTSVSSTASINTMGEVRVLAGS